MILIFTSFLSAHGVGGTLPLWSMVLMFALPLGMLFLLVYKWHNKIIRYIILIPISIIFVMFVLTIMMEEIKYFKCEKIEKIVDDVLDEYKDKFSENFLDKQKDIRVINEIKKVLLTKSSLHYIDGRYTCDLYPISDNYCGAWKINKFIAQKELGLYVFYDEKRPSHVKNFGSFYKNNKALFSREEHYIRFMKSKNFQFSYYNNNPIDYLKVFREKGYTNAFLLLLKIHEHDYFRIEKSVNIAIFETAIYFDKQKETDRYMKLVIDEKSYCGSGSCNLSKLSRSYTLLKDKPKLELYLEMLIDKLKKEVRKPPLKIYDIKEFCPVYHYLENSQTQLYKELLFYVENLNEAKGKCR